MKNEPKERENQPPVSIFPGFLPGIFMNELQPVYKNQSLSSTRSVVINLDEPLLRLRLRLLL